jgi:hypothetical protein
VSPASGEVGVRFLFLLRAGVAMPFGYPDGSRRKRVLR